MIFWKETLLLNFSNVFLGAVSTTFRANYCSGIKINKVPPPHHFPSYTSTLTALCLVKPLSLSSFINITSLAIMRLYYDAVIDHRLSLHVWVSHFCQSLFPRLQWCKIPSITDATWAVTSVCFTLFGQQVVSCAHEALRNEPFCNLLESFDASSHHHWCLFPPAKNKYIHVSHLFVTLWNRAACGPDSVWWKLAAFYSLQLAIPPSHYTAEGKCFPQLTVVQVQITEQKTNTFLQH